MRHRAAARAHHKARQSRVADGFAKFVDHNTRLTATLSQAWLDCATGASDIALDLIANDDCSIKSVLQQSLSLSIDTASSVCGAYKQLIAECLNATLGADSEASFIFFEADRDSANTSGLVVGGVRAADVDRLTSTALTSASKQVVDPRHVMRETKADRVIVYLANLGALGLEPDWFTGWLLFDEQPFVPITLNLVDRFY